MSGLGRIIGRAAPVFCASVCLSGCIAALPMIAAEGAAVGYSGYKLVQTNTGGSVGVHFRTEHDKELPPEPLPQAKRVAVWPGDKGDVLFAQDLIKSNLSVTPPGKVTPILAQAQIATDARMLTDPEFDAGFAAICKATGTELVFASRSRGEKSELNTFSLSRAAVTYSADLMTYSCEKHVVIWRDELSLVVEVSDSVPSDDELNKVGADAWADRVLQAMGVTVPEHTALRD